jgi:hypothetical protein
MATKKKKRAKAPKKLATKKRAAAKPKKRAAAKPKKRAAAKPKKRAAAKPKARAAAKPKKRAAAKRKPARRRRDNAGHLDPTYAATLREKSREGHVEDSDEGFIGRSGHTKDNLSEELGETWVETATSGEDEAEERFNQEVPEETGGPFVTTPAGQEFAEGTDESNPKGAKREPFPTT